MSLKKILLFSFLILCSASLWAVPAKRIARVVEQPDGTRLALLMRGDEHFHYLVTTDGVPVVRQREAYYYALIETESIIPTDRLAHEADNRTSEEQAFIANLSDKQQTLAVQRSQAIARRGITRAAIGMPVKGDVRVPVLLVQYSDRAFSTSNIETVYEKRLNGENYTPKDGNGSIKDYFVEQSGGLFAPQFEIIGPITLDHTMAYYGENNSYNNDRRPREMVEEACGKAYSDFGVDFKPYDNNGDGYVDIVYVIYAGYGESSYPDLLDDTIWPHQWQLEYPCNLGGVNISRYACNNELDGYQGTELDGIGTFCHEFSHCLGLPDLYDTSGNNPSAFGMNNWSVMDHGCYNNNGHTPCGYSAYEKDFLGWISLVELNNPTLVTLKPLCDGGAAYKIVNDANPDEFYVIEFRDRIGWNYYAPASGMLVTHVDYSASVWHNNTVNNDPNHQRVYVIPADGKSTSGSLAGDVYPGVLNPNTSLTATSYPAAKVYTGGYMNKDITNIVSKNGATTFSFMEGALRAPLVHTPSEVHALGFTLTWDAVSDAEAYDVQLNVLEGDGSETAVHMVRVSDCHNAFDGLSGGVYRCRVRSVSRGVCSRYSEFVEVELFDAQLPSAGAAPSISICNDSIVIQASDVDAIYYTLDGTFPTIYSTRYTTPFVASEKLTVRAIASREGHRNTPVGRCQNWFEQDGVTYRITSTVSPRVVVSESFGGNGGGDYCGHYVFGDVVLCDTISYALVGLETGAFRNAMELRSVTIDNRSIEFVGDSIFHGCTALNAVVWDTPIDLSNEAFEDGIYRNLLVYLSDTAKVPSSLGNTTHVSIIREGYCNELTLDAKSNFYCPRTFTAGKVTYRRTFKQTTGLGSSSGWETLVLPFDVQRITHATKGDITPFGVEGDNHCWLAAPQGGGFVATTAICANMPYIIAMPHNDAYGDYSLTGNITFSAADALIHPTSTIRQIATQDVGPNFAASQGESVTVAFTLCPTYDRVEASDRVYALNVGTKYDSYASGSVFVPGKYTTPSFSVYLEAVGEGQYAPFCPIVVAPDEDADEPAMPQAFSVASREGCLHIFTPEPRTLLLYDAGGRLLRTIFCGVGITEVGPLDEGLYIIGKTKIYVQR